MPLLLHSTGPPTDLCEAESRGCSVGALALLQRTPQAGRACVRTRRVTAVASGGAAYVRIKGRGRHRRHSAIHVCTAQILHMHALRGKLAAQNPLGARQMGQGGVGGVTYYTTMPTATTGPPVCSLPGQAEPCNTNEAGQPAHALRAVPISPLQEEERMTSSAIHGDSVAPCRARLMTMGFCLREHDHGVLVAHYSADCT